MKLTDFSAIACVKDYIKLIKAQRRFPASRLETHRIGNNVDIGRSCYVGKHSIIKDGVRIGDNCILEDHVIVGENAAG